jgi:23S rRNA pseudouridine2605 synthase
MKERLQKILSQAGVASRRKAEEIIKQGRVAVDGRVVTAMGLQVDPDCQIITLDGKPLTPAEKKISILLNKPKGYVTTMRDPQGRPIVTSLLDNMTARVFPVGRLDLNTEGALILTNDGDLAQKIQHPSFEVNKTYEARVFGRPNKAKLKKLEEGIELEGGKTWPARIEILQRYAHETILKITIHEGKKRQVRKMFAAIGHRVLDLKRTAYGRLELGGLPSGKYRVLNDRDLALLFAGKNSLCKKESI